MPADRTALKLITPSALGADGIVITPMMGIGPRRALGALRTAMRDLRRRGMSPRVSYVFAVAEDGRIVPSRGDDAVILVLAYRIEGATSGITGGSVPRRPPPSEGPRWR
jgi:hypothetical protein